MEPTRIVLAGCWTALMLVYLLGDVLRIYAGDQVPGQIDGEPAATWTWTLAAVAMAVPITMLLVSLLVPAGVLWWLTIVASVALLLFNVPGLPYPGMYDNLLMAFGFVINGLLVWQALVLRAA